MPLHSFRLRALALLLPLSLAAFAPLAPAATKKTDHTAARKAATVPTPFPADAAQHILQLNADASLPDLAEGGIGARLGDDEVDDLLDLKSGRTCA